MIDNTKDNSSINNCSNVNDCSNVSQDKPAREKIKRISPVEKPKSAELDPEKLKVRYLYCGMVEPDPKWRYIDHSHPFFELFGVIGGKASVRYNGKHYIVKGPCLLVYEPGKMHKEASDPETPWHMIYIGVEIKEKNNILKSLFDKGFKGLPVIESVNEVKNGLEILRDIYREASERKLGWQEVVNGLVYKLIRELHSDSGYLEKEEKRISPVQEERRKIITTKVKQYIESHYDKKLTLEDLTEVVYLSPYYLSHMFKEETGYSPIQYVINTKIRIAKELLKDPNLTISQTAERIGYDSIHYFSKLFTAVEGITPSTYRDGVFGKSR